MYNFVGNDGVNRCDLVGLAITWIGPTPITTLQGPEPIRNKPIQRSDIDGFPELRECEGVIIVTHLEYAAEAVQLQMLHSDLASRDPEKVACSKIGVLSCVSKFAEIDAHDWLEVRPQLRDVILPLPGTFMVYNRPDPNDLSSDSKGKVSNAKMILEKARQVARDAADDICTNACCKCGQVRFKVLLYAADEKKGTAEDPFIWNFTDSRWDAFFQDIVVKCEEY